MSDAEGNVSPVEMMGDDDWRCVMELVPPDDQLAARLVCARLSRAVSRTRTRVVCTLRSDALRQWAATIGSPSPWPHWVECHSLSKESYNGRVGRALAPPNENGRVPVSLDGGLGELEPMGVKPILVKVANLRALTCFETELVYAVLLKSGVNGPGNWREVTLPRRHSCFVREQLKDTARVPNALNWRLGFLTPQQMDQCGLTAGTAGELLDFMAHATANSAALDGARWALVQRPPLLEACGERVALQRVSKPSSLGRMQMANQPACLLMIDLRSGVAPPHHMDGIGDAYVYKTAPRSSTTGRPAGGAPVHFRLHDFEHIWDWINGELGSGEALAEGYEVSAEEFTASRKKFDRRRGRAR